MEVTHVTFGKKPGEGSYEVSTLSFLCHSNQEGHDFFFFLLAWIPE